MAAEWAVCECGHAAHVTRGRTRAFDAEHSPGCRIPQTVGYRYVGGRVLCGPCVAAGHVGEVSR